MPGPPWHSYQRRRRVLAKQQRRPQISPCWKAHARAPNRLNPPPILRSTQKKKKNGSRSCALCSITSAGVLYTGCSPTQGSHAESTENSVYTSVRTLPVLLFPLCIERSAYVHLALLAVQTVAHNVSVHWEVVLSDRKRRMVFDERTKETSIATKKKSNPPLTKENKSWRC